MRHADPRKYPIEVDSSFVSWLQDMYVPLYSKTMIGMKTQYRKIRKRADAVSEKALETPHIPPLGTEEMAPCNTENT